jgi:hypothetical protein
MVLKKTTIPLFAVLVSLLIAAPVYGDEGERAFSFTVNTLLFGTVQTPAHSTQNPENAFLDLYRYSGELDVRPELCLDPPGVSAVFKPRFTTSYRWWEDGVQKGKTDSLGRAFVNEWRVQVKALPTLFLSFGKEKLLWGPSFLTSPSNILFKDTEKVNPKTEVEGKYLAKAISVPNDTITINVIRETQNEKDGLGEPLKPLTMVKFDILGSDYLLSAIGYHRRGDRFRFGSFGQWTASDALVLYYDGIVTKGTDALYAVQAPASPFNAVFDKKYGGSSHLFSIVDVGGSYTLLDGSTLSMEFLYNGQGYSKAESEEYYGLRRTASDHYLDNNALAGLSRMTLNQALNNGLPFLRRYYLMGQYQVREIKNVLDVIVRYVHGLEERAGQASSIIEWRITDRVQFFNINTVATRREENEFNSLLAESCMAGIEVHF